MDIKTKELQKFLDTFAPVVEAIPAVLDVVKTKEDLDRHIAVLQAEVKRQLDAAAAIKAEGEEFVKNTQERADAIIDSANAHAAEVQAQLAKAKEEAEAEQERLQNGISALEAKLRSVSAAVAESEKAHAVKLGQIDAEIKARQEAAQARLDDVEAKYAKAEKALAALRAKFAE